MTHCRPSALPSGMVVAPCPEDKELEINSEADFDGRKIIFHWPGEGWLLASIACRNTDPDTKATDNDAMDVDDPPANF